ncbi:MAG: DNA methyltransferase [Thermoproteota archaeon]
MIIEKKPEIGKLVTFIPNKHTPVHNWFYYKEGFSRDFVELIIKHLNLGKDSWVLDPFCGVGTTQLTCKEIGVNAVGIDIAELPVFVSRVKTADYDVNVLKEISQKIFSEKFKRQDLSGLSSFIRKAFPRHVLEDVLFFRSIVEKIEDKVANGFFKLGLISAAIKASYIVKDGGVLKIIKDRNTPPFRKFYKNRIKRMIKDLENFKTLSPKIITLKADSRNLDFLSDNMFDAVITSPPYLNKIEYTKVYRVENELFFENTEPMLRSYIGDRVKEESDFRYEGLPAIAKAYFEDLRKVLLEIYRVLKEGGVGVFVIAQGVFPTGVVESEKIFSEIATEIGFQTEKMWLVNRRVATRDRVVKIGYAEEYVIFIRK